MSGRVKQLKEWLLRDLERFECGETPSPIESMRTARLEGWRLRAHPRGKEFVLKAEGTIYGHPDPEVEDGGETVTGALVWVDRRYRFVRSFNRLYLLGEHAGDEIPIDGI